VRGLVAPLKDLVVFIRRCLRHGALPCRAVFCGAGATVMTAPCGTRWHHCGGVCGKPLAAPCGTTRCCCCGACGALWCRDRAAPLLPPCGALWCRCGCGAAAAVLLAPSVTLWNRRGDAVGSLRQLAVKSRRCLRYFVESLWRCLWCLAAPCLVPLSRCLWCHAASRGIAVAVLVASRYPDPAVIALGRSSEHLAVA
jgi:hypothetical protein